MGMIETVMKELKNVETKCGCGRVVIGLPPGNEMKILASGDELQGVYWNCQCHTTHFLPVKADLRRFIAMATKTVATFLLAFTISACSGESGQVNTATVMTDTPETQSPAVAPSSSPSPTASPSASPSPSPSASPSPSPSPSASPAPYAFGGGNGTQANPYHLDTATDVDHIRDFPSAYYTLTQDINMAGVAWVPIPTFSGVIYGNLKQIQNLTVSTTGATVAGFVGTLNGTLVQVNFRNVVFTGTQWAALVDRVGSSGLISACLLDGDMTSPSGGNGYNTGTGNPVFKSKSTSAQVVGFGPNSLQNGNVDVMFNGNRVTILCSGTMCGSAGL